MEVRPTCTCIWADVILTADMGIPRTQISIAMENFALRLHLIPLERNRKHNSEHDLLVPIALHDVFLLVVVLLFI